MTAIAFDFIEVGFAVNFDLFSRFHFTSLSFAETVQKVTKIKRHWLSKLFMVLFS